MPFTYALPRRLAKVGMTRAAAGVLLVVLAGCQSGSGDTPSAGQPGTFMPTPSVPSASPSPSATPPSVWAALQWEAPAYLPGIVSVESVMSWKDQAVAVGWEQLDGGTISAAIWRSGDGRSWERITPTNPVFARTRLRFVLPTSERLMAVGTVDTQCDGGPGTRCAPEPIALLTSTDARTWERSPDQEAFAGANLVSVVADSGGMLAVGETAGAPALWRSADGVTWEALPDSASVFGNVEFTDIAPVSSGYVIAGRLGRGLEPLGAGNPSPSMPAAWWSLDGEKWTRAEVEAKVGPGALLGRLDVGSGGLVAIGTEAGGKAAYEWTSPDGRHWQPAGPDGVGLPSPAVFSDGTRLVAVGADEGGELQAWVSEDGFHWTPLPSAGAIGLMPVWPGSRPGAPAFVDAFVLAGGLVVVGNVVDHGGPAIPIWFALPVSAE